MPQFLSIKSNLTQKYLQSAFLCHCEVIVSQQERPDLFTQRWSHSTKVHKPMYFLFLVGLYTNICFIILSESTLTIKSTLNLTEVSWRKLPQTSVDKPLCASVGTSGSTIMGLTRAERCVRTVDRCRQYASPKKKTALFYCSDTATASYSVRIHFHNYFFSQSFVLTSIESAGNDLVLHSVTKKLYWRSTNGK